MLKMKIQYIIVLISLVFALPIIGVEEDVRVALLGESYSPENGNTGINEEVIKRLFTLISEANPNAVIFTGNMTLGLERKDAQANIPVPIRSGMIGIEVDYYTDIWPRQGYVFNSTEFQKNIDMFVKLKDQYLKKIPLYPIIAAHEAFGPEAKEIIIKSFKVENQAANGSPLAYTFALKNSLFVVFSIASYDEKTNSTINYRITPAFLKWIDETLKQNASKYEHIFVVGNAPAFSTSASNGVYRGLDKFPAERDAFWRILVKHKVTAYFCSGEHLYDRTNRYGIWQIISGGAGAPLYKREFDKAFYHYLLLTLPQHKGNIPKVQVFDAQGNLTDEFELTSTHYPIYQLRISAN